MSDNWVKKVEKFCQDHNIPLNFLAEILNEPKVVPMIRGKALEFSVMLKLQEVLAETIWQADKPFINAQFGYHDTDVRVIHKQTGKVINVECKLAKNDSFSLKNKVAHIKVKCMRSRTLGEKKVQELAPKLGLPPQVLMIHNDQYLPPDFDMVVTSIGNAFYKTDPESHDFVWSPTQSGIDFLQNLAHSYQKPITNLQDFAFNCIFIAKSNRLAIRSENETVCTIRGCTNPTNCGFIPNYPTISFDVETCQIMGPWLPLEQAEILFHEMVLES
jgi:hypothetical protein